MDKQKKEGVLYCVCSEAGKEECDQCKKGELLKPTYAFNAPAWKKKDLVVPAVQADTAPVVEQ